MNNIKDIWNAAPLCSESEKLAEKLNLFLQAVTVQFLDFFGNIGPFFCRKSVLHIK